MMYSVKKKKKKSELWKEVHMHGLITIMLRVVLWVPFVIKNYMVTFTL